MRPNYAMDAPPISIEVGGFSYKCATDYRVWLDVLRLFREVDLSDDSEDGRERTVDAIEQIETLVFGGVLGDENVFDVLNAISQFMAGYPSAPMGSGDSDGERTFSFEYDLNEIIIAIKNQHGVDLSYRNKDGCHWWEFLLYFHTLCGEHYILNLMQARGYKGKDKEMIKRRNACALPIERTAKEEAELKAFSDQFYGC